MQSGPFAILLIAAFYLHAHWAQIPQRFPIHWSLQGHANGWSGKSFFGVYGILLGMASLVVLLLFLGREVTRHAKPVGTSGISSVPMCGH